MMGLTKRQSEALAFIRGFIEAKGYAPRLTDICVGLGMSPKSKAAAQALVTQLVDRGYIARVDGRACSISVVPERSAA